MLLVKIQIRTLSGQIPNFLEANAIPRLIEIVFVSSVKCFRLRHHFIWFHVQLEKIMLLNMRYESISFLTLINKNPHLFIGLSQKFRG